MNVFVERISPKSTRNNGVELRWKEPTVQLSGRTSGDLICVFDVFSEKEALSLIGKIVRIKITKSAPLLLKGTLEKATVAN